MCTHECAPKQTYTMDDREREGETLTFHLIKLANSRCSNSDHQTSIQILNSHVFRMLNEKHSAANLESIHEITSKE